MSPATTPSRRSAGERHAQIQDAARELALEAGLAAVTLRAIAGRVGVTPSLVAHYAPSMDRLVAVCFTAIAAAELDEVRSLVDGLPGAPQQLDALLGTLLDGSRTTVSSLWVESWVLARRNADLSEAVRTQMDAWREFVADLLERGTRAGDFDVPDPDATAGQLLAMIDGLNAHSLVGWDGIDHTDTMRTAARALIRP